MLLRADATPRNKEGTARVWLGRDTCWVDSSLRLREEGRDGRGAENITSGTIRL